MPRAYGRVGKPAAPTTDPIGSEAADDSVAGAAVGVVVVAAGVDEAVEVLEAVELAVDAVAPACVGDHRRLWRRDHGLPHSPLHSAVQDRRGVRLRARPAHGHLGPVGATGRSDDRWLPARRPVHLELFHWRLT